jgi:hypothetical protein
VVSSGDVIAIVFETTSFTANATIAFFSDGGSGGTGLPFVVHYNGSTWSVPNSAPNWAIKYDDGSFASGLGLFSIKTVNSTNTNSSGMVGNKITPNKTMRVVGFTAWVDLDASTNVIIYGADGATEIANFELSLDYPIASSGIFIYAGYFSSPVTLEEGQTYYIMLKNNSATNVATYDYEAESVNCRLSFDGGEIMSRVTSSTLTPSSPADFTEDSVKLTALGLIIDGIESGGSTSPTETAYAFSC